MENNQADYINEENIDYQKLRNAVADRTIYENYTVVTGLTKSLDPVEYRTALAMAKHMSSESFDPDLNDVDVMELIADSIYTESTPEDIYSSIRVLVSRAVGKN